MRIALTHPFCWPHVRRGVERFLMDYTRYLTAEGHDVTLIATSPDGARVESSPEDGRRLLMRRQWKPWMRHLRLRESHAHFWSTLRTLRRFDADVVHSFFYVDAVAAVWARAKTSIKTVFSLSGLAPPGALSRLDRWLLGTAVRGADRVMVPSEFSRALLEQQFGVDAEVIPVPVDVTTFHPGDSGPSDAPRILAVASFDDRRKGLREIVAAFAVVKKRVPDAVLTLSGELARDSHSALAGMSEEVARDIEFLGVGEPSNVPRLYRDATVMVIASMWEAFGMVVVEAWASGTPVVATDHGGLSELVGGTREGVLFDPGTDGVVVRDVEALADAIVRGLELAREDGVRERCRRRAERFSWEKLGPAYVNLYR